MGTQKRWRPSHATAVAYLALFVALGGSAYAFHLGKNSVGSKQLKKNAVVTAKVKNGAITAAKVKQGALTGTQINASTLGTVPNAGHAGSADVANSLPAPEAWRPVGGPGEPAFQNGCHNSGLQDTATVRFYKDQIGIVHLEGVYNGCSIDGSTAFQLPAGFRPRPNLNFSLPLFGEEGAIVVNGTAPNLPDGDVGGVSCPVALCVLDGITFRAET
ncbi:MAG TPA: hypothetical protein VGF09_04700 [Solirubrobacterales bacterium]|jgi:hypothetical protein